MISTCSAVSGIYKYQTTYATTRQSCSGVRKRNLIACRMLDAAWMGATNDIVRRNKTEALLLLERAAR